MLKIITPPNGTVISDPQIKAWLRLTDKEMTDQAETIDMIRNAAESACQQHTGIQLLVASYDLYLPKLTARRILPMPPLVSVDQVEYTDTNNAKQSVAFSQELEADMGFGACLIEIANLPDDQDYSTLLDHPARIRFTAGHAVPVDIQPELRAAILKHIATQFAHREDFIVGSVKAVLPETSRETYNQYELHSIYQRMSVSQ